MITTIYIYFSDGRMMRIPSVNEYRVDENFLIVTTTNHSIRDKRDQELTYYFKLSNINYYYIENE